MKIIGIDVHHYDLTYRHGTYVMSGSRAATHQVGTLVRIRTDSALDGWGEVTTLAATYLPTFPDGIRAALRQLAAGLLGRDPTNIRAVNSAMDELLLGQLAAKSAIDIACWDVGGKSAGLPVSALLGGALASDFPLYEAVPLGPPPEMADFVTARRAEGVNRFQVKVGNDPLEDARRVQACIGAGDEDTVIDADANGGWTIADAQIAMRAMRDDRVYVEQPCRTTTDCALARQNSPLPLILDESIVNASDVFEAKHAAGACGVNIKLSRVGGISGAARMRDLLQDLNMLIAVEDMWGGDVITAAVSHLAATTRPGRLILTSFFNDWTDGHVAGYQPRSVNGRGSAPDAPGLGVNVDLAKVGAPIFTVQ